MQEMPSDNNIHFYLSRHKIIIGNEFPYYNYTSIVIINHPIECQSINDYGYNNAA